MANTAYFAHFNRLPKSRIVLRNEGLNFEYFYLILMGYSYLFAVWSSQTLN